VTQADPLALLRSRSYIALLVFAAIIGVPVSAAAYGFLKLANQLQVWVYQDLPSGLGFERPPVWWPLPLLALGGLLVALAIRHLPGRGGHSPAEGFSAHGAPAPAELPGIALAALATLGSGAVLGPEAPLIALGGGLGVWAVRLARRDPPQRVAAVVAAAGSFAAISTLLGSPIIGAFLLMEAAGVAGPTMSLVLVPGLLAAGVGTLIFIGLDAWTGFGTFSLSIPGLPPFDRPDVVEFGWAIAIGLAAALLGTAIRRLALLLQPHVERRLLLLIPLAGLVVGGLAIAYVEISGKGNADVLFSGQNQLPSLLTHAAGYSVGTILLLLACKGLAYGVSLSGFRGGPIFPSLFLGAAGGIGLSHLPGLPLVAGVAMGIGAMCVAMLGLPLTSVLLATLLLLSDGLRVMPLVIVAVVVSFVVSTRLRPVEARAPEPSPATAATQPAPPAPEAEGAEAPVAQSPRR
jgi:H+/Cl- antiporter ClcA